MQHNISHTIQISNTLIYVHITNSHKSKYIHKDIGKHDDIGKLIMPNFASRCSIWQQTGLLSSTSWSAYQPSCRCNTIVASTTFAFFLDFGTDLVELDEQKVNEN
jgi:hypothetical protein